MAEEAFTDKQPPKKPVWGRKEVAATVLLLVMGVLMGRMVYFFWQEGDRMCRAMQGELAHFPAEQMPCTKTSYLVGSVDWLSAQITGSKTIPIRVSYRFDAGGAIRHLESDLGDDGSTEVTYSCSALGKILMPLTNHDAWSSFVTVEGMATRGTPAPRHSVDDGGMGVSGLHTRLTVVGDPTVSNSLLFEASTHDGQDRLRRRVSQGVIPGKLVVSNYEYDRRGNLSTQLETVIHHPYSVTRRTDYTYECWE